MQTGVKPGASWAFGGDPIQNDGKRPVGLPVLVGGTSTSRSVPATRSAPHSAAEFLAAIRGS